MSARGRPPGPPGTRKEVLSVRLLPATIAAIDRLAAEHDGDRSAAIEALVRRVLADTWAAAAVPDPSADAPDPCEVVNTALARGEELPVNGAACAAAVSRRTRGSRRKR